MDGINVHTKCRSIDRIATRFRCQEYSREERIRWYGEKHKSALHCLPGPTTLP
jgi:hypothetical protein